MRYFLLYLRNRNESFASATVYAVATLEHGFALNASRTSPRYAAYNVSDFAASSLPSHSPLPAWRVLSVGDEHTLLGGAYLEMSYEELHQIATGVIELSSIPRDRPNNGPLIPPPPLPPTNHKLGAPKGKLP